MKHGNTPLSSISPDDRRHLWICPPAQAYTSYTHSLSTLSFLPLSLSPHASNLRLPYAIDSISLNPRLSLRSASTLVLTLSRMTLRQGLAIRPGGPALSVYRSAMPLAVYVSFPN